MPMMMENRQEKLENISKCSVHLILGKCNQFFDDKNKNYKDFQL